ncbi:MAG: MBL fold metallo-hydrolase [Clostridiales bacterium]|jgi:7,8-dihydropterin-6-yl-methyl-4-(beta-D-ribofuranosyl)aminobenzene 5'-phosphate synthase|nr:MBL fold metallo-hydrolase [Clostridiales bacterium]
MTVKTLVENTSISEDLKPEHGLSLYIEAGGRRVLFDMGKSGLFIKNAEKMGVRLQDVDIAVISHGHYDHGGGLAGFLEVNKKAPVYIHEKAFETHMTYRKNGKAEDIGLNPELKGNPRMVFTGDGLKINEGLELFSKIDGERLLSESNKALLMKKGAGLVPDCFLHEQNLIITEGGKHLLVTGCSHRGIVNIIDRFIKIKGRAPDFVIGGFHLSNPATKTSEKPELIEEIGYALSRTDAVYYTCHCTGMDAFRRLKPIMNSNLRYLATGDVAEL